MNTIDIKVRKALYTKIQHVQVDGSEQRMQGHSS